MSHRTSERLPHIPLSHRMRTYKSHCDTLIHKQMTKADRQTANNIYHVSEYCKNI